MRAMIRYRHAMMSRKAFLLSLAGFGVGTAGLVAFAGCGDDGDGSVDAAPAGTCMSPSVTIGSNHGHTMTVAIADVNAAANKTYFITGTAGHEHEVDITVDQFLMLRNGQSLTIQSTESGTGHSHAVTVSCALI